MTLAGQARLYKQNHDEGGCGMPATDIRIETSRLILRVPQINVYGFSPSGNCHKVKLLLEQLGRAYVWLETDSAQGATRTPEYLAKNPNGKVPMLEREDGGILVESNAILCWLAEGTALLPADSWQKAQALSWLFFEQYLSLIHI